MSYHSADRRQVQRLMADGAQVVEVLEARQFRLAHLPGALHIPAWELDRARAATLDQQRAVVVYCYDTQ